MGNYCLRLANNKVMSQEAEDDDSHGPFNEDKKGATPTALKRPRGGGGGGTLTEDRGERKKSETEKKVRFKLKDDEEGGSGGGDPGNRNGAVRRVRVVVTKEELRQILRHARGSHSNHSSSSSHSLEELMVALRSRSKGRITNGNYWRPGLESIPEYYHHHR